MRSLSRLWLSLWLLAFVYPGSVEAGQSAEVIFGSSGINKVIVSAKGNWIAARARRGSESLVVVQRVGVARIANVATAEKIHDISWDGPDSLLVEASTKAGLYYILVVRLSLVGDEIQAQHRRISVPGVLVDPLPLVPGKVLWQFYGLDGWNSIHRIGFDELVAYGRLHRIAGKVIDLGERLAVARAPSSDWIATRAGLPKAALVENLESTAMMMPAYGTGPLETVYGFKNDQEEQAIVPVGLSVDEGTVIVRAYNGRDAMGLWEWDSRKRAPGREVFVHSDYDVSDVLEDPLTGEIIGAAYEQEGIVRVHYLEAYQRQFLAKLPSEWNGRAISILSSSADRETFIFVEESATNPGDFFVRAPSGLVRRIGRRVESVDRDRLTPVESFRVESKDGTEIEAFLALPRTGDRAPLVVMPHGGPKGVRDNRNYDPNVQYLASWGFAVLQINYRGSAGYGIAFEQLGRKQWARGIEDDIDAAVEHAMSLPAVDPSRLCIVGGSYGGFSAFASVIRHPDRYRCAVSINGVTGVPLLYESSDMADSKSSMAFYEEFVGDLVNERDNLVEISPAYHVEEIEVPVLIVVGTADRRVDPDHAHRMALMLDLLRKPYEMLEVENAEHSFEPDEAIIVSRSIRRFLSRYLRPGVAFEPDPRASYAN